MIIADLHIHSHYSRATSRDCTPEALDFQARQKGIGLIGTGDFTHPGWRAELKEKLQPAGEGLYKLKPEYGILPSIGSASLSPHFVLSGEISSIYKKGDKVRKVHSLILLPGLEAAERLSKKLEAIGNLHSDGRPILGLDCRDLLEITLDTCPQAIFIPAHIWTPHFSLFGAFSGFDRIGDCFGDLTPYIHALETGLSSDPSMNSLLSALDSYHLVSNSDAHSPGKLGREANLLDIAPDYPSLSQALQKGVGLKGTLEFFPEEGKYHYDGHRKCHLCLSPSEAKQYRGKCPVCGKKLTTGVLHRILQLADRTENYVHPHRPPFERLAPLMEVIAASTGFTTASKKTAATYQALLKALGPEFSILRDLPLEDIKQAAGSMIAEGIRRLRQGHVVWHPGFDGEYGTMELFTPMELHSPEGQLCLFSPEEMAALTKKCDVLPTPPDSSITAGTESPISPEQDGFPPNPEQEQAISAIGPVVSVIAGPGTGKTYTLVSRIVSLIGKRNGKPSEITAVTFTRKAAGELRERLGKQLLQKRNLSRLTIGTFHSICQQLLQDAGRPFLLADQLILRESAENIIRQFHLSLTPHRFLREISLLKTSLLTESREIPAEAFASYEEALRSLGVLDFDDLLLCALKLMERPEAKQIVKHRFHYLFVDEFQDVSPVQYQLIKAWHSFGKELFVIGDPHQSIYGFRGSDAQCFQRFAADYKNHCQIHLEQNYRSTLPILSCALSVISHNPGRTPILKPVKRSIQPLVRVVAAENQRWEGIFIAKEIDRMVGGLGMLEAQEATGGGALREFSDIAILYRTHQQAALLEKCLQREDIPYTITGRDDFLEDKQVQGTICFFRAMGNPGDALSLSLCQKLLWNAPVERETPSFQTMSGKYSPPAFKKKPGKLLECWMTDMGLIENPAMGKLKDMASFYENMASFLEMISFGKESDLRRSVGKSYRSGAVTLTTLHGSKGLEFPVVFLPGITNSTLPFPPAIKNGDLSEERRLFYVGITRAMEELILLTQDSPSSFLSELPEEYLKRETSQKPKRKEEIKQLSLLDLYP